MKMERLTTNNINVLNGNAGNSDIELAIEEEREEQETHSNRHRLVPSPFTPTVGTKVTSSYYSKLYGR